MPALLPNIAASGVVWISADVLSFLCAEASSAAPNETGGVLLGYWAGTLSEPVVTNALGPGPKAIHEQRRFVPDYEYHELEVARLYRASDCQLQYLGDWHSHPNNAGHLSECDTETLCRICTDREARVSRPLMMILAYGPAWLPVVWMGRKKRCLFQSRLVIERLEATLFDPRVLEF
jgi:integrative and conjugative element protein (TIGR02256 family)